MNRIRRKQLTDLIDRLYVIQADLEILKDEEEEARDNIPENMQDSERYEAADAACENLDSALSSLEEMIEYIEEATV